MYPHYTYIFVNIRCRFERPGKYERVYANLSTNRFLNVFFKNFFGRHFLYSTFPIIYLLRAIARRVRSDPTPVPVGGPVAAAAAATCSTLAARTATRFTGGPRRRRDGQSRGNDWRTTMVRAKTRLRHTVRGNKRGFADVGERWAKKSINNTDYWFWHRRWRGGRHHRVYTVAHAIRARAATALKCCPRAARVPPPAPSSPPPARADPSAASLPPKNPTSLESRRKVATAIPPRRKSTSSRRAYPTNYYAICIA